MTGHARQVPALCPTPVAVHDHGNVPRQLARIEPFQQARFFAAVRFK
jgi:hypothetical protein